jgi:exosortase F-associated protein
MLLILVRYFAVDLFYDPFIYYFKNDYLNKPFPDYDTFKLGFHLGLRFLINTLISLAIIAVIFQSKQFVKFSLKFYLIAFIMFILAFFIVLKIEIFSSYLLVFYLRRFIIHPIFVLLLVPLFYFLKKIKS